MGEPLRVLIVEDSENDALLMVQQLRRGGFDPVHERVDTAAGMEAALDRQAWDVVLADFRLPRFSTGQAMAMLADRGLDIPFVVVSGLIRQEDALALMDAGAHDYVMKDDLARLVPVLRRELREYRIRRKQEETETLLRVQRDLTFDLASARDLQDGMQRLLETCSGLEGIDCGGVYVVDDHTGMIDLVAHTGLGRKFVEAVSQYPLDAPNAQVLARGENVYGTYEQVARVEGFNAKKEGLRSFLFIPVKFEDRVVASLNLASHTADEIPAWVRTALEMAAAQIGPLVARARAVERLRERERFLSSVFSSIKDGISVLDRDMNILRDNATMERWYAHKMPLVGKRCYRVYQNRETRCEKCPTHVTLQTGAAAEEHVALTGEQGETVGWLDLYSYPLRDEKTGELAGVIEYVRDVTERKKIERQFLVSQKMESVGRLAGGVAHDFNNLLGIITGFSDIILHDLSEADPMRSDMEEIAKAAQQAAGLTRQLLAFSRRHVVQPKVFDLNDVLRDMERMLGRLIGEDIELFFGLSPEPVPVRCDPVLIEQVVMNLAVNARDAMPEGGRLAIETSREDRAGHVVLQISDSGCGMDESTRERIFEPFFTTKDSGKGTGLGLSTVYGIVKQSNGSIQVESALGRGTTFQLRLPRAEPENGRLEAARPRAQHGTETVLLVEDEPMLLGLVARMLEMNGYTVLQARHGGEALLLCEKRREPIDLLLTDVVMPQMSGRELAERLRQEHPEMKVLYMSGYTDDAIIRHGVLEEGMPIVQKPFSADLLSARVRQVLDAKP